MPTQTPPLNSSLAYMFCPICRAQGTTDSPLTRDSVGAIKCQFQHGPFSGAQLQQSGADMVKSSELFPEQPTITDIKWPVWVNPTVKKRLEKKFAGRLLITIGTLLAALSDDSLVMITGEQAQKLRALGIHNGADMLAKAESEQQTAKSLEEARGQIERFMDVLKAAQIGG